MLNIDARSQPTQAEKQGKRQQPPIFEFHRAVYFSASMRAGCAVRVVSN